MKLLKIGMLNSPQTRWGDALEIFEQITVFEFEEIEEQLEDDRIQYILFPQNKGLTRFLIRVVRKLSKYRYMDFFTDMAFVLLRILNRDLLKKLNEQPFDFVHVSYNDFDDSAILSIVAQKMIKKKTIIRAFKETRPPYSYLEKKSFVLANRIVLNCKENQDFFEKKYGKGIFEGKELLIGLDEDSRSEKVINQYIPVKKLSSDDGIPHVVILAGRVFSDSSDIRSGSRLYYLPKIKEYLEAGFIVHLHTKYIYPDQNGVNQYHEYEKKYNGKFFVEEPLDLAHDMDAYNILGRYDFGVLHNFIDGTDNSEFDKVNIPNRFYEYEIAQVIPVVKRGETIVTERIFLEKHCGVVYDNVEELMTVKREDIKFSSISFKQYMQSIYG